VQKVFGDMETKITTSMVGALDSRVRRLNFCRARAGLLDRYITLVTKEGRSTAKAEITLARLKHMEDRLANTSLTDHELLDSEFAFVRNEMKKSVDQCLKENFGRDVRKGKRKEYPEDVAVLIAEGKERAKKARVACHKYRLLEQFRICKEEGWYCVFDTLTVADWKVEEVFGQDSMVFRDYVRRVRRRVGAHLYGSVAAADRCASPSDYFHYFAVVEREPRLHIHVVMFLKALPPEMARDPNSGVFDGENRCISALKKYWQGGYSEPIAVRFSGYDPYGKLGWKWPLRAGKALTPKPVEALAQYVLKYINKSYGKELDGKWRTRMSRQFGLRNLRVNLRKLSLNQLAYLIETALPVKKGSRSIPLSICRTEALRVFLSEMNKKQLMTTGKMWRVRKSLISLEPRQPYVERLRSTIRRRQPRKSRHWSTTGMWTRIWLGADISDLFQKLFPDIKEEVIGIGRYRDAYSS